MPRVMEIVTPLGEDVLLFHGMSAREEMSRLFEYQLDLLSTKDKRTSTSTRSSARTSPSSCAPGRRRDQIRYFNGYVTRFAAGGVHGRYRRYVATVRPWLWFLTRTADCRIFQDMTVPDIIKAGVRAIIGFGRLQVRADRQLPHVDLLRAVPRDRLQLRQPADGAGRHRLLLPAHRRAQHAGGDRPTSKHDAGRGYETLSFIATDEQVKPDSSTSARGTSRARSSRASTCTTTTTSSGRASS